jgi:DNA uptake protein ComE-like DNA-binding protein
MESPELAGVGRGAVGVAIMFMVATAGTVAAECVDLNEASLERLTTIVHINEERADQVIAGRPWPGVRAPTQVHCLARPGFVVR